MRWLSRIAICLVCCLLIPGLGFGQQRSVVADFYVVANNDDAEERIANGSIRRGSSDLELIDDVGDNGPQVVGIRFQNVAIPQGATIVSAYLEFRVDELDNQATALTIEGQLIDNAPVFTNAAYGISSRARTVAAVSWDPVPAWTTVGEAEQSPEVYSVVQELVNQPGWVSGAAMVFIITGSGQRTAESRNASDDWAPRLKVEYSGTPPTPGAGGCWGGADTGDRLVRIDTSDGSGVIIGRFWVTNIEALAVDPSDLSLYATNADQLGRVNVDTGAFSALAQPVGSGTDDLGATVTFSEVDGLTFDQTTGLLYGVCDTAGQDVLLRIDPISGAMVADAFGPGVDCLRITGPGIAAEVEDIAFNPLTGTLYGAAEGPNELIAIDPTDGTASVVGAFGANIEGMSCDAGGTLYGTAGRRLYLIDMATGAATQVGSGNTLPRNDYEALSCDFTLLPQPEADFSVTKDDGVTTVTADTSTTYTITVQNSGPDDVTRGAVTDIFPSLVSCTWTCVPDPGASCTAGPVSGDLDDRVDLPSGTSITYTAVCDVDRSATGSLVNTVSVESWRTSDPDPGNNSATDIDTIIPLLPDGDFEGGNFGGCWAVGGGGSVEVLQAANFTPAITPPDGNWFALISNGPGAIGGMAGDFDGNGVTDNDGSTLSTSFLVNSVPAELCFDWAFLTSEQGSPAAYDDIFDVTLNGASILSGSVNQPGGVSPFPDTAGYDGVSYQVTSAGPTNNSSFASGLTGFSTFCTPIAATGAYTVRFLVADQTDTAFDSGLLIDNVLVPASCVDLSIVQVTDSSGANLEVKGGGFAFSPQGNSNVAMNDNASVLAWVSNGDYTNDNPNLQEQIFAISDGTFERVTALTGDTVGRPALTSNGRWLTFATTGDLTPGAPGNSDANSEIFRWDRTTSTMLQITDTAGCTNRTPSIGDNDGGSQIAFATDCSELNPGFNPDGNSEAVVWDSGTFVVAESAGCENQQPVISSDVLGRYVTLLSNCDYAGGNPDSNTEVFQGDRQTGTVVQVTDSSLAAGELNGAISSSFDGQFVSFLSNANYTGANPDQSLEVFLWDRAGGITQLTDTGPLTLHISASIEDSGQYVAVERIDFMSGLSEIVVIDTVMGTTSSVVSGDPALPAIALVGAAPAVAFQSGQDLSGGNTDTNVEIWTNTSAFGAHTSCSSPGMVIPDDDLAGATDTLTILDTGTLADLDVEVQIDHTWVGDLAVTLTHVDTATSVTIIDRPGEPVSWFGCDGNNIDATLDDEAALAVEDECAAAIPTIEGSFIPLNALSAFDGEDFSGDWELTVSDAEGGDTGILIEWCLVQEIVP